jgi:subtilase family serine protease
VNVQQEPRPDLTAGGINISPPPRVGEPSTVSASVTNVGAIPSPSIPVRFLADGAVVFSTTMAPLANGQSGGTSFSWTPSRPGAQVVR